LVGYYDGVRLIHAASIRNGLTPATRAAVIKRFGKLGVARCPFANLPEAHKGLDRHGHEKVPMDSAAPGRRDRVPRMDPGKPSAAREVRRFARRREAV
jgi:hypothetical protein